MTYISHNNLLHHTPVSRHPLNVKPSGNQIVLADSEQRRLFEAWSHNLGSLSILNDELLYQIITYITDPQDLKNLGHASRVLYAFTYYDDLWKNLYLSTVQNPSEDAAFSQNFLIQRAKSGDIDWKGSWRKTLLRIEDAQEAKIQCENNLICSDLLFRPFQCSQINYKIIFKTIINNEYKNYKNDANIVSGSHEQLYLPIERISEDKVTLQYFEENLFDKPFIITNKKRKDRWPEWTLESLLKRFPKVVFQQEAVNWTLESYSKYLHKNDDESPLYLFDCDSEAITQLSKEYNIPDCFQKDLFKVFNEKKEEEAKSIVISTNDDKVNCRPNFRWLIVGSERTGSTFHKDPNATSAWNAVLSGCKLWIMVPPHITPPGVNTDDQESEVTSPVSLAEYVLSGFFADVLKLSRDPTTGVRVGITYPGECNYVPNGWWHLVINVEDTVALTQNFTPVPALPKVLYFLKNKKEQISGLNVKKVEAFIETVLQRMKADQNQRLDDTTFTERIEVFENYLKNKDSRNSKNTNIDNEDDECIGQVPFYDLFKELLIENGYSEILAAAEEKLKSSNKPRVVKQNQRWENVVGKPVTESSEGETSLDANATAQGGRGDATSGTSQFSFSFGFDEADSDIDNDDAD